MSVEHRPAGPPITVEHPCNHKPVIIDWRCVCGAYWGEMGCMR